MGFLLLVLFGLIVLNAITQAKAAKVASTEYVVEAVKTCPPHKWNYREVKDTEGNFVTWKMVCDVCGPLKPIN